MFVIEGGRNRTCSPGRDTAIVEWFSLMNYTDHPTLSTLYTPDTLPQDRRQTMQYQKEQGRRTR